MNDMRGIELDFGMVRFVPPLQGGGICFGTYSWGFTPGYHIAGFQPKDAAGLRSCRRSGDGQRANNLGPKARNVIARPEGPGFGPHKSTKPCKGVIVMSKSCR